MSLRTITPGTSPAAVLDWLDRLPADEIVGHSHQPTREVDTTGLRRSGQPLVRWLAILGFPAATLTPDYSRYGYCVPWQQPHPVADWAREWCRAIDAEHPDASLLAPTPIVAVEARVVLRGVLAYLARVAAHA